MSLPSGYRKLLCVVAATGLVLLPLTPAYTQILPEPAAEAAPADTWTPPDITTLQATWWTQFNTGPKDSFEARAALLVGFLEERIKGLGPEDQAIARGHIDNLKSLFELLAVVKASPPQEDFEPVPTKESWTLGEFFELRRQIRELADRKEQFDLQVQNSESQANLIKDRRDSLLRQYKETSIESPARILLGLSRITSRVEYELNLTRSENLRQRYKQIEQQILLLEQQQMYARQHLVHDDRTLAEVKKAAADARARVSTITEKIVALQPLLLEALSTKPPNLSLEILRKQQMIRAVVESELTQVEEALARFTASWYRFRSVGPDSAFDQNAAAEEVRQITEDALKQSELGTSVSQATLIATLPADNQNAVKNFELAQSMARETLVLVSQIKAASDDLKVLQELLGTEIIDSKSGFARAWDRMSLSLETAWDRLLRLGEISVFDIGDVPVTLSGLFELLLILVFAFAISSLIRFLLNRGMGRKTVSKQAAAYTLGRLLHYLIILIGLFVALGSIGVDFTSFALIAGALSVGIGFGLQAIVNNFVSGLILLFEGTLRVGDFVELDGGLQGVVREINTRATLINTNTGVDVVVPNSELVTTRLTNWTLRESSACLTVPFSVAYGSDKELVKTLALEAARKVEYVLQTALGKEPQVILSSFGDNALEFQALLWVSREGVRRPGRVKSNYLWKLETLFRENHIEIPFPQRDIRIRGNVSADPKDLHADPESPRPGL